MPFRARYDGYADWYESWNKPHAERNASEVHDLLGPGHGLCLDLGCGGGHYFDVIAATGRTVVGLDYSADQRHRLEELTLTFIDEGLIPGPLRRMLSDRRI